MGLYANVIYDAAMEFASACLSTISLQGGREW